MKYTKRLIDTYETKGGAPLLELETIERDFHEIRKEKDTLGPLLKEKLENVLENLILLSETRAELLQAEMNTHKKNLRNIHANSRACLAYLHTTERDAR